MSRVAIVPLGIIFVTRHVADGSRLELPDFFRSGVVVEGEGLREHVVLVDVVAEGGGVVVRVGRCGFRVERDESRGMLLNGADDGGDLLGAREVVIVDEFHGGGIVEREVESECGVVEERFTGPGALGEPLEFAEFLGIGEGGAADGQVKDGVGLGLAVDGK